MLNTLTDTSPRMAALPGEKSRVFSTTQSRFECEIPREQWYFPPAPPKVRKKPAFDQSDWRALGITAILAATFVATVPTPVPAPAATRVPDLPTVLPEPPAARRAELATPRAELVVPDVRRAELVDIPLGTTYRVAMPDGNPLLVTYKGDVSSFDQLPKQPGWNDMYRVAGSGHSWVWTMVPAIGRPAWIDP